MNKTTPLPCLHETAIGRAIAAVRAQAKASAEQEDRRKRAAGVAVERQAWTKAEEEDLVKMWLETPLSAREIGKQSGRSRGSIIGKANRLGLRRA
jgi:hypothetical protein